MTTPTTFRQTPPERWQSTEQLNRAPSLKADGKTSQNPMVRLIDILDLAAPKGHSLTPLQIPKPQQAKPNDKTQALSARRWRSTEQLFSFIKNKALKEHHTSASQPYALDLDTTGGQATPEIMITAQTTFFFNMSSGSWKYEHRDIVHNPLERLDALMLVIAKHAKANPKLASKDNSHIILEECKAFLKKPPSRRFLRANSLQYTPVHDAFLHHS